MNLFYTCILWVSNISYEFLAAAVVVIIKFIFCTLEKRKKVIVLNNSLLRTLRLEDCKNYLKISSNFCYLLRYVHPLIEKQVTQLMQSRSTKKSTLYLRATILKFSSFLLWFSQRVINRKHMSGTLEHLRGTSTIAHNSTSAPHT